MKNFSKSAVFLVLAAVCLSIAADGFVFWKGASLKEQNEAFEQEASLLQEQLQDSKERRQNTKTTNLMKLGPFIQTVEDYLAEPAEPGRVTAFVALDGDRLNQMNAMYGYDRMTGVIKDFAAFLRESFPDKQNDIICNVGDGSDEFYFLLKNRNSQEAVVQEMNALLEKWRLRAAGQAEIPVKFTFSAGITFVPGNGADFFSLYKKSDQALYKAKQNGRDQCQVE